MCHTLWDTYRATIAAKVSAQPFIAARCSQGTRRRDNDVNSAPWCTMTAAVLSFPLCNAHSSAFCPHCHQFKQAWRIKDVYSTRHAQCSYGGHRGRGSSACKQILGDLLPPFLCRVHERCFARLWDVETASETHGRVSLGTCQTAPSTHHVFGIDIRTSLKQCHHSRSATT